MIVYLFIRRGTAPPKASLTRSPFVPLQLYEPWKPTCISVWQTVLILHAESWLLLSGHMLT